MRADRLISVLLLLQSHGRVTAAELARALEVSVATARRDLLDLSAAGIPVYPQPGRGGGWQLLGGARTDLSGLSAPEARALFTLLGPAAAGSDPAKVALRKLVRALPATFRAEAEAAAGATVLDPARWGETRRAQPEFVALLQAAVSARRQVRLTYTDSAHRRSDRVVDPWGVVDKDGSWYLIAGTGKGQRTFRVDRIVEAQDTGEPAHRPADFDLAATWDRVVDELERTRSRTWATLTVEARFAPILHDHFGRHFHLEAELDRHRVQVRVAAPTPRDLARSLAGWGALVEVLEPEPVRTELARIGRELLATYPPRAGKRSG